MAASIRRRLVGWEGLLLVFLLVVLAYNVSTNPRYFEITNQVNLFTLGIEKSIPDEFAVVSRAPCRRTISLTRSGRSRTGARCRVDMGLPGGWTADGFRSVHQSRPPARCAGPRR